VDVLKNKASVHQVGHCLSFLEIITFIFGSARQLQVVSNVQHASPSCLSVRLSCCRHASFGATEPIFMKFCTGEDGVITSSSFIQFIHSFCNVSYDSSTAFFKLSSPLTAN